MTPKPRIPEAALRAGTVGQIDRSAQYEGRHYSSEALKRNDDLAFQKIRQLEADRFRHGLITAIVSAAISYLLLQLPDLLAGIAK
jgi:hypothetical protein